MCFSVQVDKDIKKLSQRFQAGFDRSAYDNFEALRSFEAKVGLREMEKQLGLSTSSRRKSPFIKQPDETGRVYSNTFTNVIVSISGHRLFQPMRYRVRPWGSKEEIPSKYNVFNARIDALEERQTWKRLFMSQHGLFPFSRFFEWVEPAGKKKLISFSPQNEDVMWAPCLWDEWISNDKKVSFRSFAILTDDPPPEVQAMGHDRCPIFLREDQIDEWLNPTGKSKEEIYRILKTTGLVYFEHQWAA